jgi:signal transduction histidine kinase
LSRCLGNVIDNSIRYAGGAEVACRKVDGAIVISVRDHGPGMTDDLIAHAFEPFFRGRGQEGTLGTGIGLTIAQAHATGGELTVSNHPEGGLLVLLRLMN